MGDHSLPEPVVAKTSKNPLAYSPREIAKSLVALLTCIIGGLGYLVMHFSDGPFSAIGGWALAAALFLTPIVVFLQKAQPILNLVLPNTPIAGEANLPKKEEE